MTRSTRLLVHGTGSLLIVALIAAPVWDYWHYRGLRSSVGPRTPLAIAFAPSNRTPVLAAIGGGAPDGFSDMTRSSDARASRSTRSSWGSPSRTTGEMDLMTRAHAAPSDAGPPGAAQAAAGRAADAPARDSGVPALPGQGTGARRSAHGGGPVHGPAAAHDPGTAEPSQAHHGDQPGDPSTGIPASAVLVGVAPRPTNARDIAPTPPPPGPPPPTRASGSVSSPGDPALPVTFEPEVTLVASNAALAVGDSLTVTVNVRAGDPVTSLPFHLMFDPAVLEFSDGATDPSLGSRLQPVLLASVSPNRPGDLAVGLSFIESAGAFKGTGGVVVLHFRAIGSGDSDLEFSRASLRGATSEPLPAAFHNTRVAVH